LSAMPSPQRVDVLIVGGGVGGICSAIKLQQAGFSVLIVEKGAGFGGTWRWNTYPGCGCDVVSMNYHFSFEPKFDWKQKFAKQPEILEYFEAVGKKYGLYDCAQFNTEVVSCSFNSGSKIWTSELKQGGSTRTVQASAVIAATGLLHNPTWPSIEGLESFKGVRFHANQWDHNVDLEGKRVAVIGSGATATQFVPHLAEKASQLTVCQRTPNYYMCGPDAENVVTPAWQKWLYTTFPLLGKLQRLSGFLVGELLLKCFGTKLLRRFVLHRLSEIVKDRDLRRKLTPDYPIGFKRVLIGESNNYLRALQKPNVTLETAGIVRIVDKGIETQSGVVDADVLICSTGFSTTSYVAPMKVECNGMDLQSYWKTTPRAYLGMVVPGFPNFFLIYGPNSNLGHNSIIFMIECQVNYIVQLLQTKRKKNAATVQVREDVASGFNEKLQGELAESVWAKGSKSWYMNENGLITQNWSGTCMRYWWHTLWPRTQDFDWGVAGQSAL